MSRENNLLLERVLGVTSVTNSAIAVSANEDCLIYAAGCVAVIYPIDEKSKQRFIRTTKPISSICSASSCAVQKLVALGERGHQPSVSIFDQTSGKFLCSYQLHAFGVSAMQFSPDGRYIASVGFKHDKQLVLWDIRNHQQISSQKVGNKVCCLSRASRT